MNITDYFNTHFEIVPADTNDLLEEVLKLRYQVFCVETTILNKRKHSNCRERDQYDNRSAHRLIRHKETGLYVASVRLVLHDPDDPKNLFPIEKFCSNFFYKGDVLTKNLPRESLCEVSRFLISKERQKEISNANALKGENHRTKIVFRRKDGLLCYLVLFGLISSVIHTALEKNRPNWYVCVEPSLFRLLKQFGIVFTPIGPSFDYNGQRLPCFGTTESVLNGIHQYRPDLWKFVTQGTPTIPIKYSQELEARLGIKHI